MSGIRAPYTIVITVTVTIEMIFLFVFCHLITSNVCPSLFYSPCQNQVTSYKKFITHNKNISLKGTKNY